MAQQPFSLLRRALKPSFAEFACQAGMVLGNVADVIGHTAPDIEIGIVLQRFKNRQHRTRVFDKGWDSYRPGQAWTCPFGTKPSHMGVWVIGPLLQLRQGALRPSDQKRADGKFRTEPPRQFVLG